MGRSKTIQRVSRRGLRFALLGALVLLPVAVHLGYSLATAWPSELVLAGGSPGGRYREIAESLAGVIERQLGVRVRVLETEGSLANLHLLRAARAHLGLYQPGTEEMLEPRPPVDGDDPVTAVANLYSQPVHVVVRRDAGIRDLHQLAGKRVCLGLKDSGDHAMGRVLLRHAGLENGAVEVVHLDYGRARAALASGAIDALILTLATCAPVFAALARDDRFDLLEIECCEALTHRKLYLHEYRIPEGECGTHPYPLPTRATPTVAAGALLIAREDLPASLVEDLTRAIHDPRFVRANHLIELSKQGTEYSHQNTEFPYHAGALGFYEPTLRPLLDPDFVEATEGIRSFLVSLGIAAFLVYRWLRDRRSRRNEHRLDRYVRTLLDIEKRQLGLDEVPGGADSAELQGLLDEVTRLRQDALREFSAHELNEDRGIDCFIQMCHALCDKMNAKLTRQRTDLALAAMAQKLEERWSPREAD